MNSPKYQKKLHKQYEELKFIAELMFKKFQDSI